MSRQMNEAYPKVVIKINNIVREKYEIFFQTYCNLKYHL